METSPKEMLLRMIVRCRKVRKHKPKSVEVPALTVTAKGLGVDSTLFADSEIKHGTTWSRLDTERIRLAYKKHNK